MVDIQEPEHRPSQGTQAQRNIRLSLPDAEVDR